MATGMFGKSDPMNMPSVEQPYQAKPGMNPLQQRGPVGRNKPQVAAPIPQANNAQRIGVLAQQAQANNAAAGLKFQKFAMPGTTIAEHLAQGLRSPPRIPTNIRQLLARLGIGAAGGLALGGLGYGASKLLQPTPKLTADFSQMNLTSTPDAHRGILPSGLNMLNNAATGVRSFLGIPTYQPTTKTAGAAPPQAPPPPKQLQPPVPSPSRPPFDPKGLISRGDGTDGPVINDQSVPPLDQYAIRPSAATPQPLAQQQQGTFPPTPQPMQPGMEQPEMEQTACDKLASLAKVGEIMAQRFNQADSRVFTLAQVKRAAYLYKTALLPANAPLIKQKLNPTLPGLQPTPSLKNIPLTEDKTMDSATFK